MTMALEGIRVLDLTTGQQGPVAAAMLADMGAEVIKIEEKDVGDPGRKVRTEISGKEPFPLSYYFENNNRNKRGIALNFRSEAGRNVVYRLADVSDVFLSNFPLPTLKELGFDYDALSKRNSKIIYAVATALGPKGPDKDKPATGETVQFLGGILSHGNADGPVPFWGGLAEQQDAILLAYGIVNALIARERHGVGQEVYSSLLGSQINWAALNVQGNLFNGVEPWGMKRDAPLSPFWNFYETKDKKWICLGFLKEAKDWPDLCRTIEREDLEFDPRFDSNAKRTHENTQLLLKIMEEVFAERTLDEWVERMSRSDIAWSVLNDYPAVAVDPQVLANEYVVDFDHPKIGPVQMVGVPFRLSETPGKVRTPAPDLGQHTKEVLTEMCGYSSDEVGELKESGVI
ncbi:MAG: CaiB/BaiF CoA transferase family protein [Dehalococcoidia bacterium]